MLIQFKADVDSATEFTRRLANVATVRVKGARGTVEHKSFSAKLRFEKLAGLMLLKVTRSEVSESALRDWL